MPSVIDNRIVEMVFNNKQFEQGVATSMGTLDKLKNALNFSSSVSNFGDVTKAFTRFGDSTLSDVAANVQSLADRFSTWGIVGMRVIEQLTDKAMAFVNKALQPITSELGKIDVLTNYNAGWQKYADKTQSVQTIMSATTSTWEEDAKEMEFVGSQMEYVDDALSKLNWFSDETSYSFTDMTSNIGKFTAQGVKLSTAVEAMEGISVWAAKSGQGTNEAARAMYNLSQALGVGSVKLMDWRSVENANMGTLEFKNTVLETAVAAGELTKSLNSEGEALYRTRDGLEVTAKNFSQTLSEGWFTKDVLLSTLSKYGNATTLLSDVASQYNVTGSQFLQALTKYNAGAWDIEKASEETGIAAEDLITIFEKLNSEEYALGLASFKMAQEAKTFSEAMDATADATSTAWMNVFESIFGNYEEAKGLWTELAIDLSDVFATPVSALSDVFAEWKKLGGRDLLFLQEEGNYGAIIRLFDEIMDAGKTVGKTLTGYEIFSSPDTWAKSMFDATKRFKESLDNFFDNKWDVVLETIQRLTITAGSGLGVIRRFFGAFSNAFATFREGPYNKLFSDFDPLMFFNPIINAFTDMSATIDNYLAAWLDLILPSALSKITELIGEIGGVIKHLLDTVGPVFEAGIDFATRFGSSIYAALFSDGPIENSSLVGILSELFTSIENFLDSISSHSGAEKLSTIASAMGIFMAQLWGGGIDIVKYLAKGLTALVDVITDLWNKLDAYELSAILEQVGEITTVVDSVLSPILEGLKKLVSSIGNFIVKLINSGAISDLAWFIKEIAISFSSLIGDGAGGLFKRMANGVDSLSEHIPTFATFLKDNLPKALEFIRSIFDRIRSFVSSTLPSLVTGFKSLFSGVWSIAKVAGGVFTNLLGLFNNENTEQVGLFGKAVEFVGKVIGWIGQAVSAIANVIKHIGPTITTVFGWLFNVIRNIGPTVVSVISKIGEGIGTMVEKIKGLSGKGEGLFSLEKLFKLFQNGALSVALVKLIQLFGSKGLGGIFASLSGFLKGEGFGELFKGFTGGLGEGLKGLKEGLGGLFGGGDKKNGLDPGHLKEIATSLLMIAASCLVLSLIDPKKLTAVLGGLAGALTEISLAFALLAKFDDSPASEAKGPFANLMDSMSTKNYRKSTGNLLISMAAAILVVALALKVLSTMDWNQIGIALTGMFGALAMMVAAMMIMEMAPNSKKSGAGLMIAALGMIELALALKILGTMNTEQIGNALKAFVGALLILTAALVILSGFGTGVIAGAAALLIATVPLLELAAVLVILAQIKWEKMSHAILALGIVLGELVIALGILSFFGGGAIAAAAAIVILSVGLLALTGVLAILGKMKWETISQGLKALALMLTVITGFGALLGVVSPLLLLAALGLAAFGAALIATGKGLLVMAAAITAFQEFAGGVGKLAGVLAVLSGMSVVLALVSPLFLVAAVGMLAFGAALVVLGKGLLVFAAAVAAWNVSMDIMMASIKYILLGLISMIPALFTAIAQGIVQMVVVIAQSAGTIADAVLTLLTTVLAKLTELIPVVVELVYTLLSSISEKFFVFAGEFVVSVLEFLNQVLASLAENIGPMTESAVLIVTGFITGFLEGLAAGLPSIIQAAWDLMIAFVDGIANGIDGNWERLMQAFKHLFWSIINAILGIFTGKKTKDDMTNAGDSVIENIKQGIKDKIKVIKETITGIVSNIGKWFKERWSDMKDAGGELINGLKEGISSKLQSIGEAVKGVANTVVGKVKNFFGIHSPSTVFAEIGGYTMEGLALGIKKSSGLPENSVEKVGNNVRSALEQAMENASAIIENGEPVITPVVDLSNVASGSRLISSMIGGKFSSGHVGIITDPIGPIAETMSHGGQASTLQNGSNIGAINFTINTQPGQNAEEIADEVMARMNTVLLRGKAAWA